jgi:acyl-CoA thioesterase-1
MFRFALTIVTLLVAVGCTSLKEQPQNTAQPAPSSRPEPRATDNRPVIVAFGDSLSEGYGAEPGRSFPDFLQQSLDKAGYQYRVVNMGISGDTTTGGLGRVDTVIEAKPDIVILELGGNDGLRGVPVAASRKNLDEIIRRLRASGVRQIVLAGMSLPPNYGGAYIKSFEKMYRELAEQHKLTLIPFLFEDIARQLGSNRGLMQQDGIHPTAAGNRIMAETVFRYLYPILRKT